MAIQLPKWTVWVAVSVIAVLSVMFGRALYSSHTLLEEARQARDSGRIEDAIWLYSKASRWYVPVVGADGRARAELLGLCRELEQKGRDEALGCYRALRRAVLAIRWLIVPEKDVLDVANRAIARIVAKDPAARSVGLDERTHLSLLRRTNAPDPWLAALSVACFLGWLASLLLLGTRGLTKEGRVLRSPFVRYLSMGLGFWLMWLLFLYLA